jgi:hypothetical protein
MTSCTAMELSDLSDSELLEELSDAQGDVAAHGLSDMEGRQDAWQRVTAALRELERRYPPATQPRS